MKVTRIPPNVEKYVLARKASINFITQIYYKCISSARVFHTFKIMQKKVSEIFIFELKMTVIYKFTKFAVKSHTYPEN